MSAAISSRPWAGWATGNGFTLGLSALVIYDSFIHSGGILDFLRARFSERPPARGGNKERWISQNIEVRHAWLSSHHRPAVRSSRYRTRDLRREIGRGNWDLSLLPINANGTLVDAGGERDAEPLEFLAAALAAADEGGAEEEIPFLEELAGGEFSTGGEALARAFEADDDEGEEPAFFAADSMGDAFGEQGDDASPPALASQILSHDAIMLATEHVSGVNDAATARQNTADTAAGRRAQRSAYGNAPGGSVALQERLLRGLLALDEEFTFSVSEIAGGSHSRNSRHCAGVAADFNILNGRGVGTRPAGARIQGALPCSRGDGSARPWRSQS